MNYQKIYDSIVLRAKTRKKPNCYTEKHHILPKSMGGSDDKENIAVLTAREHFICHWLLLKIHKNKSMIFAFFRMTKPVGNGRTRYVSHSYKYAKEIMSKFMKETRSGAGHPMFGLKGENNPNFGSKRNDETKKKISEKSKERFKSGNVITSKSRAVICIETGEFFCTVQEAKKKYTKGNVSYALRFGGTAGGFSFCYAGYEKVNKLKGYCKGENHLNSKKIIDEYGNIFYTSKEAAKSINATGTAVLTAIKQNRKCKGVLFVYV